MIERLVLLSLKPPHQTDVGRAEVVARAEHVIARLPQVRQVVGSVAADERTQGAWDICLRLHFGSLEDVAAYLPDVEHRTLVDEFLKPRIAALKTFNFESGAAPKRPVAPVFNHLHLHVRDVAASVAWYRAWFGVRTTRESETRAFLVDDAGFELALFVDAAPAAMPDWFHFGLHRRTRDAVLALHDAMTGSERILKPLGDWGDLVSFRVADPDGYPLEIYWENQP